MVKRRSSRASNSGFQVQILVEALCPWCRRLACDAVNVEVAGSTPPGHPEKLQIEDCRLQIDGQRPSTVLLLSICNLQSAICNRNPRSVADRTRPCEGRGSGSTPDEDTTHWRLQAFIKSAICNLQSAISLTLEPDGQATGCNPVEVGSIPTGVSEPNCRSGVHQPVTLENVSRHTFVGLYGFWLWRLPSASERNRPTAGSEYMLWEPVFARTCGFESHRHRKMPWRNGRRAESLWPKLRRSLETRPTAGAEYMVTRFES